MLVHSKKKFTVPICARMAAFGADHSPERWLISGTLFCFFLSRVRHIEHVRFHMICIVAHALLRAAFTLIVNAFGPPSSECSMIF